VCAIVGTNFQQSGTIRKRCCLDFVQPLLAGASYFQRFHDWGRRIRHSDCGGADAYGAGGESYVEGAVRLAARVDEHGVGPPGTAVYSPLPTMVGLTDVGRLLVRVTVLAALVVATLWGAKVRVAGANVSGRTAVPLALSICWFTAALSLIMIAPLITPQLQADRRGE
jgi:hypothetical protein